jgi:hypothetical protein
MVTMHVITSIPGQPPLLKPKRIVDVRRET